MYELTNNVRMYVRMYECMHIWMYECVHECMYASTHVFIYIIPCGNIHLRVLYIIPCGNIHHHTSTCPWDSLSYSMIVSASKLVIKKSKIHLSLYIVIDGEYPTLVPTPKKWDHSIWQETYFHNGALIRIETHTAEILSIYECPKMEGGTSKPWVSILKWSKDLDAFGYPYDLGNPI